MNYDFIKLFVCDSSICISTVVITHTYGILHLLHCALASGVVYCNRSCLFVCGWVGMFVMFVCVCVCGGLLPR